MLSNPFYRRILDNLVTAIFLLDQDFRVSYTNPAAEMLFKMSHKRISSNRFISLFAKVEEHFVNELHAMLESERTYTQRECEFTLFDGSHIFVDCNVSSFAVGKKTAVLIEMQPKDQLLRISREEQLHENQEAAKIMVRSMAHEIKNPLGGIRGAAQLLDAELTELEHHEYTKVIIEESDRLRNLVDRMLGPNEALVISEVNIHEILERVCSLIHAESRGNVLLEKDYDPSIPDLHGDKSQLIQAFLNIARNALQALSMDKDRQEPARITIRSRAIRQFTIGHTRHRLVAKIEFIDNGPGIPKELIQNIFYPMISGHAEGTGLGLSITQSIFNRHHGLVECESKPGATNFIIYLPLLSLENKLSSEHKLPLEQKQEPKP